MKTIGMLAYVDETFGGIYQYTQSMTDALMALPEDRCVIFSYPDRHQYDRPGIETRRHGTFRRTMLTDMFRATLINLGLSRFLVYSRREHALYRDVDIFMAPTHTNFYLRRPFIYTLHDMQERYYPENFDLANTIVRRTIRPAAVRMAARVLCESQYVKNDIVKFLGAPPDKVCVLPAPPPTHFMNRTHTPSELEAVRRRYELPGRFLLYPAQFYYHKNHLRLLDAFRLLAPRHGDVHLILTGLKEHNYAKVMRTIGDYGLAERVKHLGYIEYTDLPAIYRMAEMLVMPTLFESISIPIYEAFSLQVPVCTSNVVGLPEQVGDAALLFDPLEPPNMAAQIERLLVDKAMARALAQKGYERVKGFNHAEYSAKLLAVVQGVCERSRR